MDLFCSFRILIELGGLINSILFSFGENDHYQSSRVMDDFFVPKKRKKDAVSEENELSSACAIKRRRASSIAEDDADIGLKKAAVKTKPTEFTFKRIDTTKYDGNLYNQFGDFSF